MTTPRPWTRTMPYSFPPNYQPGRWQTSSKSLPLLRRAWRKSRVGAGGATTSTTSAQTSEGLTGMQNKDCSSAKKRRQGAVGGGESRAS
jgi:hypothetical protein